MSDLCKCGHDATAHSFGHGDCGWTGGIRTALCPCRQFTRGDKSVAPADRDDLAAILAKHAMNRTYRDMTVRCWGCDWTAPYGLGVDSDVIHRAHVAQTVLESDWLRERDAVKWDEGYSWCFGEHEGVRSLDDNPYRADRADNTTDRT